MKDTTKTFQQEDHKGHEDGAFLQQDNEGNEGMRFTGSDVANQTFVGSLCSMRLKIVYPNTRLRDERN